MNCFTSSRSRIGTSPAHRQPVDGNISFCSKLSPALTCGRRTRWPAGFVVTACRMGYLFFEWQAIWRSDLPIASLPGMSIPDQLVLFELLAVPAPQRGRLVESIRPDRDGNHTTTAESTSSSSSIRGQGLRFAFYGRVSTAEYPGGDERLWSDAHPR